MPINLATTQRIRVLLVDDDNDIRGMVADSFEAFADLLQATDGQDALDVLSREVDPPDVIVTDANMPRMGGFELARRLRANPRLSHVPIIMVTGNADREFKLQALDLGIDDYLTKPVDLAEVRLRVRNQAKVHSAQRLLKTYNDELERRVNERTRALTAALEELTRADSELRAARRETVLRLGVACEYRDDDTASHLKRMAAYSAIIAEQMGLPRVHVDLIEAAAPMHDVGKIGVPDNILLKPGRLTPEEFKVMQQHPGIGARILGRSHSPLMQLAETIALNHHEKVDGSGYPRGLKGDSIPIEGRIVALSDVFDALTTKRCYKPAFDIEKSLDIITQGVGTHFDREVASAFFKAMDRVREVYSTLQDGGVTRMLTA